MQITHHTTLLNALIEKYNLKSYLEIGVQNPANNFDKISIYGDNPIKIGVDPETDHPQVYKMTSDEFFVDAFTANYKVDLIFIDGLHHADQVKRDFENSLRCLSDNGFIVIHDVLPENEEGTAVPRQTKIWWGDVYKFAMNLHTYSNIDFFTMNIDNGCMIVRKTDTIRPSFEHHNYTWEQYQQIGHRLMNVTSTVEI